MLFALLVGCQPPRQTRSVRPPPTVTRVDHRGGVVVIERPDTVVVWLLEE